ncbi:18721_t:CDS:2, partial [Gigaspora margarita]
VVPESRGSVITAPPMCEFSFYYAFYENKKYEHNNTKLKTRFMDNNISRIQNFVFKIVPTRLEVGNSSLANPFIPWPCSKDPSNWSFFDFLSSNFEVIVNLPPGTNDINGLAGTWLKRFKLEVEARGYQVYKIVRQQNVATLKKAKIIADEQGRFLISYEINSKTPVSPITEVARDSRLSGLILKS